MLFVEDDTDVLSFRVFEGVAVVSNVTRFRGKDAVVSSEFTVLAGEPGGPTLAEDDVSRNHILSSRLFRSQSLARPVFSTIGSSLRLMTSISDEGEGWWCGGIAYAKSIENAQ